MNGHSLTYEGSPLLELEQFSQFRVGQIDWGKMVHGYFYL